MPGPTHVTSVQLANMRLGTRTPTGSVMVRLAVTVLLANTKQKMVYLLPVLLVDVTLVVRASTMVRPARVAARTVLTAGTVLTLGAPPSPSASNVSQGNTRTPLGRQLHVRIVIRVDGLLLRPAPPNLSARNAPLVNTVTRTVKPPSLRARTAIGGGTNPISPAPPPLSAKTVRPAGTVTISPAARAQSVQPDGMRTWSHKGVVRFVHKVIIIVRPVNRSAKPAPIEAGKAWSSRPPWRRRRRRRQPLWRRRRAGLISISVICLLIHM